MAGPSGLGQVNAEICGACELDMFTAIRYNHRDIVQFLVNHGVLKASTNCRRCGQRCLLDEEKLLFRCNKTVAIGKQRRRRCNFNVSARVGSFVERTHLTMVQLFNIVIVLLWFNPPRQEGVCRALKITHKTFVDWYSFVREVYLECMVSQSGPIGGPNTIVEIDEAKFGRSKYNRGRRIEGQWIFGGVQRDSDNCFLVPVPRRDAATLLNIIKRRVLPGTTIISDCWKAYDCLSNEGFRHLTVNHSVNFVDPVTGAHTNNVERGWREIRAKIPRYGLRAEHYPGYLAEYLFKKTFDNHLDRLHHFFRAAAQLYRPTH